MGPTPTKGRAAIPSPHDGLGVDRGVVEYPRVVQVVGLNEAHKDEVPAAAGDELIFDLLANGGKLPLGKLVLIGRIGAECVGLCGQQHAYGDAEISQAAGRGEIATAQA